MNRSVNGLVLSAQTQTVQQTGALPKGLDSSGTVSLSLGGMRKIIALMMCAPLLAGCASSSSTMLSDDTAMIAAWGAGLGDRPRVIQATLTEAAKLTRAHYYRYFVILRAEDVSTSAPSNFFSGRKYAIRSTLSTSPYKSPEKSKRWTSIKGDESANVGRMPKLAAPPYMQPS